MLGFVFGGVGTAQRKSYVKKCSSRILVFERKRNNSVLVDQLPSQFIDNKSVKKTHPKYKFCRQTSFQSGFPSDYQGITRDPPGDTQRLPSTNVLLVLASNGCAVTCG